MAVETVSHNATTTLGLSLLEISEPSGHQIDELGLFKSEYLSQDLILASHIQLWGQGVQTS